MVRKKYQLIEHTADIGIIVTGKDLKALFANAASAAFDIVAEKRKAKTKIIPKIFYSVKQEAEDLQELLVNWLNELLFLSATKEVIFVDFTIKKLAPCYLEADVAGYASINYRFKAEVKAATYHELKIEKARAGWKAQVIFDL
ncbi:MAG: archease [Candidatus Omnitrophota bacterium]|jgi:SHS2 domain-containing protein